MSSEKPMRILSLLSPKFYLDYCTSLLSNLFPQRASRFEKLDQITGGFVSPAQGLAPELTHASDPVLVDQEPSSDIRSLTMTTLAPRNRFSLAQIETQINSPYSSLRSVQQHSAMQPSGVPKKEILIAVMGVTGAGKSYFVRAVSGNSGVQVSGGLHSCTSKVQSYSFEHGGATITLIDTPGFNDTTRSDTEVLTEICDWTSQTFKEERLLSGIIYLHRITDVRMDGSAVKNLRMFQKLCGRGALKNVFLTTTQWSRVTDLADGESREKGLCQDRNFWGILLEKGATLQRFQGTRESGLKLIEDLMSNQPEALDIQDQIVTQKRTIVETDAGQCINEELIEQEKKYKEELKALERERQEAIAEKDEEMKELLAEEQKKAQEKLEKAAAEKKMLAELHAEELRKREIEKQNAQAELEKARAEQQRSEESHAAQMREQQAREAQRVREEQARAVAEAKRLADLHAAQMREQQERQDRRRDEQERAAAEASQMAALHSAQLRLQQERTDRAQAEASQMAAALHAAQLREQQERAERAEAEARRAREDGGGCIIC